MGENAEPVSSPAHGMIEEEEGMAQGEMTVLQQKIREAHALPLVIDKEDA